MYRIYNIHTNKTAWIVSWFRGCDMLLQFTERGILDYDIEPVRP